MGASLLAMTVCQPANVLTEALQSRAGSLPRGIIGAVYVELRRNRIRSNADLFVDGMRGYWASSAMRTQL
ncbi:hypothetical protein C4E44_24350 [Pseudomonas sp. MWU12-2312b]|nr:hypothetical protein C4E44_24350 [Pseudomonas sp. MWU12-2312b]